MTISHLLVTSRQPVWLRLLLTTSVALASIACTSRQYEFITCFAWLIGYLLLTGIPWLIVRRLPSGHPVRQLQTEHDELAQRFWSYRRREDFWIGFGLLVALFAAHGSPKWQHCGPFIWGGVMLILGVIATHCWRTRHHALQQTGTV
jgi:hypothetical protein